MQKSYIYLVLFLSVAPGLWASMNASVEPMQRARTKALELRQQDVCRLRFRREAVENIESGETKFFTTRRLQCDRGLKDRDEWGSLFDALLGRLDPWQKSDVDALMKEALKRFADNEYQNFANQSCRFEEGQRPSAQSRNDLPFEDYQCELRAQRGVAPKTPQ